MIERDKNYPTCPIRNVVSKILTPDTLWIIHLISEEGSFSSDELHSQMVDSTSREVDDGIQALLDANVIEGDTKDYRLTSLGESLVPSLKGLEQWCFQHA